jgi:chromosome segregation ATPase
MVQTPEKKTKKVWTNDDVKSVKGGVSVVGDGDKASEPSPRRDADLDSHRQSVAAQQLANYRNQIQQFRAQIDAIDKRIVQLRDFKAEDGSASGGIKMHQTYNMVPLEEQVKQLESKKKELQAKIADVENQARKSGIAPGELR